MAKKKKPIQKLQVWIEARRRHRLSQAQMARELGIPSIGWHFIDRSRQPQRERHPRILDIGSFTHRPPVCARHASWIRILLHPRLGCRFDGCVIGSRCTPAFSTGRHMLSAKVQLGRVLIVGAAAQPNIGLTMFPTARPGS